MDYLLRLAKPSDALACSAIVNNWIDNTNWMPRFHPPQLITEMIENGIPKREFWIIGEPVVGYLSLSAWLLLLWLNHIISQEKVDFLRMNCLTILI